MPLPAAALRGTASTEVGFQAKPRTSVLRRETRRRLPFTPSEGLQASHSLVHSCLCIRQPLTSGASEIFPLLVPDVGCRGSSGSPWPKLPGSPRFEHQLCVWLLARHLPSLGLSFHPYNEGVSSRSLLWAGESSRVWPLGQPRNPAKGWGHLLGLLAPDPFLVPSRVSPLPCSTQLLAAVPRAQAESPAWRVSG